MKRQLLLPMLLGVACTPQLAPSIAGRWAGGGDTVRVALTLALEDGVVSGTGTVNDQPVLVRGLPDAMVLDFGSGTDQANGVGFRAQVGPDHLRGELHADTTRSTTGALIFPRFVHQRVVLIRQR